MILVAIWDKGSDVYTRPVRFKSELKDLKYNNKKPDKILITHEEVKKIGIHKLRSMISFTGIIVPADGDTTKLFYNGMKKDNVRIKIK